MIRYDQVIPIIYLPPTMCDSPDETAGFAACSRSPGILGAAGPCLGGFLGAVRRGSPRNGIKETAAGTIETYRNHQISPPFMLSMV